MTLTETCDNGMRKECLKHFWTLLMDTTSTFGENCCRNTIDVTIRRMYDLRTVGSSYHLSTPLEKDVLTGERLPEGLPPVKSHYGIKTLNRMVGDPGFPSKKNVNSLDRRLSFPATSTAVTTRK